MNSRTDLINYLNSALNASWASVSSELPWVTGGIPLHQKNLKTLYLDEPQRETELTLMSLGTDCDIYTDVHTLLGYLVVDAKNTPSDLENVIVVISNARHQVSLAQRSQVEITTTINDDRIEYVFTYEFRRIQNPQ